VGNSPTATLSGQDQSGALTVSLDQLEPLSRKAKPLSKPATPANSLSVPLEELEPAQPKQPAASFDSVYGKPAAPAVAQNPFGISTVPAAKPTPTAAAARVTEPMVKLAPPENPKPPSDYWTQEYAARQRDIEKINQADQGRQRREQETRERQAEIARQPLEMRAVQSMTEPGTTLGTVMRQQMPEEPGLQFESDYFKHRATEAAAQGKSGWSEFPRSLTETLVRSQNPRMGTEEARRIAEPFTVPLADLPTITGHTQPFAVGAERAVGGFTSPENLALLGSLGALEGAAESSTGLLRHAPRLVSGLFATQMGAGLVDSAREYQAAKAAGDVETAQRILGSAAVQVPLTILTAYHAGAGRLGAPVRAEELLDTVHAADTIARTSSAEAAPAPSQVLPAGAAHAVTVPVDELQPVQPGRGTLSETAPESRSAEVLRRVVADESLPAAVRDAAQTELERAKLPPAEKPAPKFEAKPPEPRTLEKVEASPYQRQQAQLAVNRVRDIYTREYAQSYLKANLEGAVEPDRGNLSPLDAAAIRRSIDGHLVKEPPVSVAQKYAPDILEEAQAELRAAHDLASSFERPGRYHPDLGPEVSAKEQDKAWYGVGSSRAIVAAQFPWYSDESVTPGKLEDAVQRGKGANYERVIDRIADHIQAQREEARPVLEEFAPQLETLAAQVRDVDPELSQTLLDIRSGRYASLRDLPAFIEGKVADAQRAAEFSRAFDELADAEAGDAIPEGAPEGAEPHGGSREAGGREEEARRQLAPLEIPLDQLGLSEPQPTNPQASDLAGMTRARGRNATPLARGGESVLPGMESVVEEQRQAVGREQARQAGEEFNRPSGDIEAAAGRMERESPLFRGSAASPQNEMFASRESAAAGPEREYENSGKQLGIEYRGVMGADMGLGDKAVVIYQDPESKTSIGVKVGEWSPERVQEKLKDARARMAGDPTGGTMYSGLGFLDPALIRRVMPESIKNALSENISEGEREAGIVREKTGELARKKEQVFQHYADAMAQWEKRPIQEGRDFILREQRGEKQPNAADQAVADQLRKEFATRRQAIEDLSHGSFDHWKEHYFPQLWERPTKIADWVVKQIMGGKRPLQGPAGFRKARVFEDIQEGLDAGFNPITNNPVTMALLKLHEMDRYTMAHEILGTMKGEDLAKAVMVGDHAPEGWTRIADGISTIYGDRNIPIKEYYDEAVLNKLSETAKNLGIEHERAVRIGGSRLGYTSEGSNRIVTRFATPEAVIAHEIGHQLDWKYGLKDQLVKDPRYKLELRKLVDLKWEGKEEQNVPESFRKYIRKGEEKMATIVEALVQAPDKFREVAPNTWAFLQKLIANNPELKPLLEAKPSLVYGQRSDTVSAGGMVIRGYYYAPAEAARVLNNYLAPGLRGNPLYDLMRGAGNTLNQAQLGFSAFHAMFSGINSTISDFALALRKASRLNITEAAKASARAVPLIASPIRHVITGTRLMREYLSPGTYAKYSDLADAVAKGGGRIYQDPLYRNASIAKFWKAWGEGDWKQVGLQAFPAALEKMASPVMEHLVPRLKLGAFADIARESLDRLPPGAGKAEIRAALDRAWDSVDNRFGQVVYDNLFVNKVVKDLGLISVRSLGWNLGTVRELGGAAKDTAKAAGRTVFGERPQFTDRMAYTLALPIVTGYIGALVNYAYTGQGPQELKDYFFPRTGRTLANGEPERISLPTYMKDVYAFAKHPLETVGHKAHPLISMIAEMLQNKDFYGVEIRHADDPLVKQVKQVAGYVAEQASPLSLRNLRQRAQAEGRPGVAGMLREAVSPSGLQSFFGITPAPASVTHTAAEEKALQILEQRRPKGTRTAEEYDRQARRSFLRGELAAGRMQSQDLAQHVRAGEITPREAGDILKQSREAPIAHYTRSLSLEDFLSVWDLANAKEQAQLRPLLIAKQHLLANLPAEERVAMAARLRAALTGRQEKQESSTSPVAPFISRQ
jgi:hypothetical protein